eukprot:scaffold7.g3674.t1
MLLGSTPTTGSSPAPAADSVQAASTPGTSRAASLLSGISGSPSSPKPTSSPSAPSSPSSLPSSFFAPIGGGSSSPKPSSQGPASPAASASSPAASSPKPPSSPSSLPSSFFAPIGGGSSSSSSPGSSSSSPGSSSSSPSSPSSDSSSSSTSPDTAPPSSPPTATKASSSSSSSSDSPATVPAADSTNAAANTGGFAGLNSPPAPDLPPSPPDAWRVMAVDRTVVYDLVVRGPYIMPFTQPKAYIIAKVLHDRYLRAVEQANIHVQAVSTFTYLDFGNATSADAVSVGSRRLKSSRDLLQARAVEKSGAEVRVSVDTAQQRVASEIDSVMTAVQNGTLAADLTLAGVKVDNVTMAGNATVTDLKDPNASTSNSSSFPMWIIAIIVLVLLLAVPVPLYFYLRRRQRKRKEALQQQAAVAAAARARMESRTGKGKSFTLGGGKAGEVHNIHNIQVRSGSVGGLAGFGPNGRGWGQPREHSMSALASGLPVASLSPLGMGAARAGSVPSLAGTRPFTSHYPNPMALGGEQYEEGSEDCSSEEESARR